MYKRLRSQLETFRTRERPGSTCSGSEHVPDFEPHRHLRLLTFNIQVGINTSSYHHYFTRSWQHVLPHRRRAKNLDRIATLLSQYDVVALQECDGGSLRSGYINQVQYLAESAGIPYWYQQLNRNLGPVAQHSNGLLSRFRPLDVTEHKLPGLIPGRGAIIARYGSEEDPLVLVLMHLSLSKSAQQRQLGYIREQIGDYRHVVLMGDMNAHAEQLLTQTPLKETDLVPLPETAHSFPSWRPEKALDHILVSPSLEIRHSEVVSYPMSDHLPIAMDVALPKGYLETF
ncbi:endonuclease/exonuclease/phosphatase family protein [Marinobacter persicus]|jgi:endonuclease/exonuclease/phosphatase family metal-dependent hydrolase|uniref:Endonuclease/exonuclease/phosphatase family metal-dependent hydrolase n=1 Tax=Marinobacter persicus TaxID=930118 RepID=A0A2S6G4M8_9GAMM|nr:endonuclease/exonuclease/phosphatase family protein [Marinobacter persicus]PPK50682.1 endonuclease/exonuclease/phosphatase family metal-dependent hydrolase [Marinobacter persicus]PPK54080.1 endonuclease/exonuclease/phosphatase family metal-dependent hydrolase [Marinobacter persicus]PPK57267.1 endonuclease/exonuclease/phosphatase family metal-dependent hydrolase [Marinobacter persicus]